MLGGCDKLGVVVVVYFFRFVSLLWVGFVGGLGGGGCRRVGVWERMVLRDWV